MNTTIVSASEPVRAASLDAWASYDWSHGVFLPHLDLHDRLLVQTRNSTYELIVTAPNTAAVLVRGGTFFPEFTAAVVAGSSMGAGFLKLHGIYPGFQLELINDEMPVITTRVRTVTVLRNRDSSVRRQ